jgi:hypothetical protein
METVNIFGLHVEYGYNADDFVRGLYSTRARLDKFMCFCRMPKEFIDKAKRGDLKMKRIIYTMLRDELQEVMARYYFRKHIKNQL